MAVFTRKDSSSRRSTDRIGHITPVKTHTYGSNAIDIGGRCILADLIIIGTYGLIGMIIRKNKNDIGWLSHLLSTGKKTGNKCQ
jgi:hypothetical protein